jgi:hypothetical protein
MDALDALSDDSDDSGSESSEEEEQQKAAEQAPAKKQKTDITIGITPSHMLFFACLPAFYKAIAHDCMQHTCTSSTSKSYPCLQVLHCHIPSCTPASARDLCSCV